MCLSWLDRYDQVTWRQMIAIQEKNISKFLCFHLPMIFLSRLNQSFSPWISVMDLSFCEFGNGYCQFQGYQDESVKHRRQQYTQTYRNSLDHWNTINYNVYGKWQSVNHLIIITNDPAAAVKHVWQTLL